MFDFTGFVFAFTAGFLALFSPCAFPLLPGYVSYYLGARAPLARALKGGGVCALGVILVFVSIGVTVSYLGRLASRFIPAFEGIAGATLIFLGVAMLLGVKRLSFTVPVEASREEGFKGLFVYGVLYGLAGTGCSAPIFLSMVFYAMASGGLLEGVTVFTAYALGIALPLMAVTVLTAKAKRLLIEKMYRVMPMIQKIGGILLIIIGLYLIYITIG